METYKIQANASGTRNIAVTEEHLNTIKKYSLLKNLIDSNGIIDEPVLDKLKLNVRSMLESSAEVDKELLDLCLDVIYNNNMKLLACISSCCCLSNGKMKTSHLTITKIK